MPLHHALVAMCLLPSLSACTAAHGTQQPASTSRQPEVAATATPSTSHAGALEREPALARLVGGEWTMTVESGYKMHDRWHWGPGRHSLRGMTHGHAANGDPWHAASVMYWHPGRKEIRAWGINPFSRSVFDGVTTVKVGKIEFVADLYQVGNLRKVTFETQFDGPDKHFFRLFEEIAPGTKTQMFELVYHRAQAITPVAVPAEENAPKPSQFTQQLVSKLAGAWQSTGKLSGAWLTEAGPADAGRVSLVESTFEWIPYADGMYASITTSPADGGESSHVLDIYLYHHTGRGVLRCLALSNRGQTGGVYEGDVTILDGGSLQFDLNGYEGDQVIPHTARIDFNDERTVHTQIWTTASGDNADASDRMLVLDLQHKRVKSSPPAPK